MKRPYLTLIAAGLLCAVLASGCGSAPQPTPDLVATQVAVMQAAAATLTAAAPAPPTVPVCTAVAATPVPPTAVPTLLPTAAPTVTRAPTVAPTATAALPPTGLPPTARPSLGLFAVVGVYSDDVLNVRSAPGADQPIVVTIPYYGRDVEVYPGEQQVGGSRWVPVGYGAFSGWVNARYLARQEGSVEDGVAAGAAQVILALRDHNWTALADLAHPVKGVTFSPYAYVRPLQGAPGEADLVFSAEQLKGLWADPTVYHWGSYDGSGLPIDLTFQGYYAEFVYDADFAQPEVIGFDQVVGQGNTINNIAEVYPNGVAVEYHFSGFDPQYGGMDWRSLRLVLEEWEGRWVLVGIVHDQWTI